ncbi:MAG: Smr/MutS family protein [Desulfobacterales bacterium]|jgi:DNA-nicking Smr family endonuclease
MKPSKTADRPLHRPFADLKNLLQERELKQPPPPKASASACRKVESDSEEDALLFQRAMTGVAPLNHGRRLDDPRHRAAAAPLARTVVGEDDTVNRLNCLIRDGKGFIVSQTPEYMEGKGPAVAPDITERLHRGHYSIEAHIDLHGQTAAEAEASLNRFLRESTRLGRRAVLVIHGRGLSSPDRPVLKNRVDQWLGSGFWRKWVAAYCSARMCDGGAGATYVLLRARPLTKKQRKKRRTSNAERPTSNVEEGKNPLRSDIHS